MSPTHGSARVFLRPIVGKLTQHARYHQQVHHKMKQKLLSSLGLLSLGLTSAYSAIVSVPAGDITTNTTWLSSNEYVLEGTVVVKNATLTIQGGTIIRNQPNEASGPNTFNPGVLVITTSAKINAQGSATNPIIFTTAAVGTAGPGAATPDSFTSTIALDGSSQKYFRVTAVRWTSGQSFWDANPKTSPKAANIAGLGGGVVILGKAYNNYGSINAAGTSFANAADLTTVQPQHLIEGFASNPDFRHGGTDDSSNSGVFSYVSIRHQGASLLANNELNGLSLGSIGKGSKIDHIEIWGNVDDGIEVWGGTVNLSYLQIVHPKDDGLDIDLGYRGTVQFVSVIGGKDTDKLSEIDGHDYLNDSGGVTPYRAPYGTAQIWNATLIGYGGTPSNATANNTGQNYGAGIHHRRGGNYTVANSIIANLSDTTAFGAAQKVWLRQQSDQPGYFTNIVVPAGNYSQASGNDVSGNPIVAAVNTNIFASDPVFGNTFVFNVDGDFTAINPLPFGDDVFTTAAQPAGLGLVPTNYLGAFDNANAFLWTDNWTASWKTGYFSATLN